jgi:hypothetical protein
MTTLPLLESDAHNRPKPHAFFAPRHNRIVIWLVKRTACLNIKRKLKVTDIAIDDADLELLRGLRKKRCLLMPSHSGGFEPYIIVYISKLLRESFSYLAAIEAFQRHPAIAWIMQRMGAYSIIRGAADRLSFQMTRRTLSEGKRWLVVFPEGQTVWQNDTVIPFQEGVTQLAFKALEDISADHDPSLLCIPMAIKYSYQEDMSDEIEGSLKRLESQFEFETTEVPSSSYDRLRRIAAALLTANETKHTVKVAEDASLDDRIQCMKETIVRGIEEQLEITPRADQLLLDRIRGCFNAVDKVAGEALPTAPYAQKLAQERTQAVSNYYADLWRVLQLVAIYDGYVRETLTVERFLDVLCLLEMEVFGERRIWGPRKATIKLGTPVDLNEYRNAYKQDKRNTIQSVSRILEESVRSTLTELSTQHSTPFITP